MKTPEEINMNLENAFLLREAAKAHSMGYCDHLANGGKGDSAEERWIEALEAGADALTLIRQLESQVPKWISVEERLPEDDVAVLVYAIGNNENSCVAMTSYTHHMYGYNIEGWRSPWQYFFYERKITHWMPLPEPPKEE